MRRIFKPLTYKNLEEIRDYALDELERFLYSEPYKYEVYDNNLIAICLCQGSAQHYIDGLKIDRFDNIVEVKETEIVELSNKIEGIKIENGNLRAGIHDIDVWIFFYEDSLIKIPHIRNCRKATMASFSGLGEVPIDFMKKTISEDIVRKAISLESTDIMKSYLWNATTDSSKFLCQKSIVGLYPLEIFAEPIWKVRRIYKNTI